MAFFDVTGDGTTLRGRGFDLPVPSRFAGRTEPGHALVLGIRPEHFIEGGEATHSIEARIEVVEPLGADVQVNCDVAGQAFTARLAPTTAVAVGDRVRFTITPDHMHLFDKASGEALPRA